MRSAILSIGSELIDGFVTDTNATFLAQEMSALGIQLMSVQQVGDDLDRIVLTLKRAWEDGDLIVTTGGIGPTGDDLTRESIAALLGESVTVDQDLLGQISGFFSSRGIPMPERNTKQAWLIPSAAPLPNPMGTAPGWFVTRDKHTIVTMPGVPREMKRMWSEQAVPRLLPALGDRVIASITLKTLGLGESAAEREIIHLVERGYPIVATYAKDDGVHIRITATAQTRGEANGAVEATAAEIRSILGSYVYGDVSLSLPAAIVAPLHERRLTMGIFGAGSGGRMTEMLAEDPAAALCFREGDVRDFWSVARGYNIAMDDPDAAIAVAKRDAEAARSKLDCDFGVGIAVQIIDAETQDRAQGYVGLAISGKHGLRERRHQVQGIHTEIRRRAAMWAADFLRTELLALVSE